MEDITLKNQADIIDAATENFKHITENLKDIEKRLVNNLITIINQLNTNTKNINQIKIQVLALEETNYLRDSMDDLNEMVSNYLNDYNLIQSGIGNYNILPPLQFKEKLYQIAKSYKLPFSPKIS